MLRSTHASKASFIVSAGLEGRGENCLFVYLECTAVGACISGFLSGKSMFSTVSAYRIGGLFSLKSLARTVGLPPWDMHSPMHFIVNSHSAGVLVFEKMPERANFSAPLRDENVAGTFTPTDTPKGHNNMPLRRRNFSQSG